MDNATGDTRRQLNSSQRVAMVTALLARAWYCGDGSPATAAARLAGLEPTPAELEAAATALVVMGGAEREQLGRWLEAVGVQLERRQ